MKVTKNTNRLIMGSALGLAAIAVAIDHTRHRLPEAAPVSVESAAELQTDDESPCSMIGDDDSSPCGFGDD